MGTIEAAARPAPRRSDAGKIRYTERDVAGLLLLAEHYAAPYDLLAVALSAPAARTRAVVGRWRAAGLAASGSFGPGPAWCWLTAAGMAATGRGYPVRPPSLARLAHYRAVLAARLWLQAAPAYAEAQPWWNSERRIRAALPTGAGAPHVPDAEIHWPDGPERPHAGQIWAIEVELTPKTGVRTARILAGLLSGQPRYAQVVYLTSPAARHVVAAAAGNLPPAQRGRVAVRDLPDSAFAPKA
jgi:hypothetical protein